MIDIDKLQRQIDAIDAPVVCVRKDQLADLLADIRSGRAARLRVAREIAVGSVCASIAASITPPAPVTGR